MISRPVVRRVHRVDGREGRQPVFPRIARGLALASAFLVLAHAAHAAVVLRPSSGSNGVPICLDDPDKDVRYPGLVPHVPGVFRALLVSEDPVFGPSLTATLAGVGDAVVHYVDSTLVGLDL